MRYVRAGLGLGGAAVIALLGYLAMIHLSGNFHTVVPGVLYRSAQVTPAEIARHVRDQGIRSVLNLRGADPGVAWYEAEIAASAANGLVHADFHLSASERVDPAKSQALIALMKTLPKPILIHCERGADRSGLAAALYLAAIAGLDEDKAEGQLSIRYGHFSVPYLSAAWPMDESWEDMEPVLGFDS